MVKKQNLSESPVITFTGLGSLRIAIVTAEWNPVITHSMRDAAEDYLLHCGIEPANITKYDVPGSYELPLGAQMVIENNKADAVICIGCIIQGETRHFEFIANAVANGIMEINIKYNVPVSFGVLTTNNHAQALDRAGGKHGNKGTEAAGAVMAMLKLRAQQAANDNQ